MLNREDKKFLKWNIPLESYLESMEDCLAQKAPVP